MTTTNQNPAAYTILMREGSSPRYPWRQYLIVADARVVVVHMIPAGIAGWNVGQVQVQGGEAWSRMSREQILAWKARTDDGLTIEISAESLGGFLAILLQRAGIEPAAFAA